MCSLILAYGWLDITVEWISFSSDKNTGVFVPMFLIFLCEGHKLMEIGDMITIIFWSKMGAVARLWLFDKASDYLDEKEPKSFFELEATDIKGNHIDFSIYRGKKAILVVNVASKWALTSKNYTGLTKLYNDLLDKSFEILAFPANQFYNQEGGSNEEICRFAQEEYKASFTLFEKIEINGPNTHPVYRYLRNKSELFDKRKKSTKRIPCNFAKFLLNSKGDVVRYFDPLEEIEIIEKEVKMLLWYDSPQTRWISHNIMKDVFEM